MDSRQLAVGAMERWGAVRIGVMSASEEPGLENARLRLMSPQGSATIRVPLGESRTVDGVGTVTLHSLALHRSAAGDGPAPTGRGSVEVSFDPMAADSER